METATRRSTRLRAFFANYVYEKSGADNPRILEAFAAVPREPFAGPGPWSVLSVGQRSRPNYVPTPDDDPAFLYQDTLIALDAERGINIGEPSLHARCLDALDILPGDQVLHVGAGSAYYTAILAHLVGSGGRVHAFEVDAGLAARAKHNLSHLPWVGVQARSGIARDLPTVDVVYVSAGIGQPSWAWLDVLRPFGRLLFPLQSPGQSGAMLLVQRLRQPGTVWPAQFLCLASFISCQCQELSEVEQTSRGLAAAFSGDDWQSVQSLHLGDNPDDTCWFRGKGWWLSTMDPDETVAVATVPGPTGG